MSQSMKKWIHDQMKAISDDDLDDDFKRGQLQAYLHMQGFIETDYDPVQLDRLEKSCEKADYTKQYTQNKTKQYLDSIVLQCNITNTNSREELKSGLKLIASMPTLTELGTGHIKTFVQELRKLLKVSL